MKHRKLHLLLSIVGFLVALDQLTKIAVTADFRLGESLAVITNFFNLTLIHNAGAAFGLLANLPPEIREPFFLVLPSITLAAILYAYYKLPDEEVMSMYGLILIVGGALGNLIDRARLGYVIDFLDFHWFGKYHFPAFNVADSAICVGVGILIVNLIMTPDEAPGSDSSPSVKN